MRTKPTTNLLKKENRSLDFALGAALGVLVFLLIYGVSTLNVSYDSWIYKGYVEADIIQRYAGWMYYRAAPWNWPLTVAENLMAPIGSSIAFTDSIPLVSVLCKVFAPILPETFQFFGWYNLLNFVLQGGFSMLLLRHFKLSRLYCLPASLLLLTIPIFIERSFRHDSLASQWMVLAALLFYLRARRWRKFPIAGFFVLCVLAPGLHTYFMPMVYALLAAALIEYIIRTHTVLRPVFWLLFCFVGTLVMAYIMGILTRGGGGSSWGFGHFSMNLNSLFNPYSVAWSDSYHWSRLIPVLPQLERQYDGFNYLGLGVLAVWPIMVAYGLLKWLRAKRAGSQQLNKRAKYFLWSHLPLLVVLACLSVFAVSNLVAYNGTPIFQWFLPEKIMNLCGIFRASGRMFWPCTYLLTFLPLLFIGRVLPRRWPYLVLAGLLAVQLWDISGVLIEKHKYFASGPLVQEDIYSSEPWREVMQEYDEVFVLDDHSDYSLAAGLIRWNPEMVTNLMLVNRGSYPAQEALREETRQQLLSGQAPEPGRLYLTKDTGFYGQFLTVMPEGTVIYEIGDYYLLAAPR